MDRNLEPIQCKKMKAKYVAECVKLKIMFSLRRWQYDKVSKWNWETMALPQNFVSFVVFPSDWDAKGNIIEYTRISWLHCQCLFCVCENIHYLFIYIY